MGDTAESRPHSPATVTRVEPGSPVYPANLLREPGPGLRPLQAIGMLQSLGRPVLGLVCSVRLPGRIMLETYEWAQLMKRSASVVAGGFHSPMERECFELMLHGCTRLVLCPPRGIAKFRLPAAWRPLIASGRLLILSTADDSARRATRSLAGQRNRFVVSLSDHLLVPHAARGSATELVAREAARRGIPLFTFPGPENENLLKIGARAWGSPL